MGKLGYILIGGLLIGLVIAAYINFNNSNDTAMMQQSSDMEENATSTENEGEQGSMGTDSVMPSQNTQQPAVDHSGTHIMPDGSVMMADGTVLTDAKVLADGKIQLADGTIITPAADLRTLSGASMSSEAHMSAPASNKVSFDISGVDFAYDKKEIRVKKGDTVTINFRSDEGFHDWVVDEFNAATERVNEGGTTSVTFVADKVGTFQYYCSVMNHRQQGMIGYLIVE